MHSMKGNICNNISDFCLYVSARFPKVADYILILDLYGWSLLTLRIPGK